MIHHFMETMDNEILPERSLRVLLQILSGGVILQYLTLRLAIRRCTSWLFMAAAVCSYMARAVGSFITFSICAWAACSRSLICISESLRKSAHSFIKPYA